MNALIYIYEPTKHAPRNVYRTCHTDCLRDRLKHAITKERARVLRTYSREKIQLFSVVTLDQAIYAEISFGKYVVSKRGNLRRDAKKLDIRRTETSRAGFRATHAISITL